MIETLAAIFIITVGLISGITLITSTVSFISLGSAKLTASYLAQEGIEIVRNIRDKNWIAGQEWDYGFTAGVFRLDYNDNSPNDFISYDGLPLNIDSQGLYSYDAGAPTIFRRSVRIKPSDIDNEGNPIINILVLVEWDRLGETHKVEAREYLYNWK